MAAAQAASSSSSIAWKARRSCGRITGRITASRREIFQKSRRSSWHKRRTYALSGEESVGYPEDEIAAPNERAKERLESTPIAVAACYDRRIGRVVVGLSTDLPACSGRTMPRDWKKPNRNSFPQSRFHCQVSESAFPLSMPIAACPAFSKASGDRGNGWHHGLARREAKQPQRQKLLRRGQTASGGDGQRNVALPTRHRRHAEGYRRRLWPDIAVRR